MIIIDCKTLSVCFEDTVCGSSVEIFPPFTTKTFANGFSVFGADGKSFYIPNNTTYEFDGVSKTYEEVVAELPLCLSGIIGNNEVQCFADFASFPPVGEDCVLYLDQNTNSLYYWNGATYVSLSKDEVQCFADPASFPATGEDCVLYIALDTNSTFRWNGAKYTLVSTILYDAIVTTDGSGTHSLPSEAFAAGAVSVFVKDGVYTETANIDLPSGAFLIGESTQGVQIIFTGGLSIETPSQTPYTTGTISIPHDSSTVTGAGTTFTVAMEGQYIQLGQEWYKIETFTNATTIVLSDTYRGNDIAAGTSFSIQQMTTGIQIQDLSVIGTDGATVNSTSLIDLNAVLYGQIENVFLKTTNENCVELTNCANIAISKTIGTDAGNGGAFGRGITATNCSTVKISECNFSNNNDHGASLGGTGITTEASHFNNNGASGVLFGGTSLGAYIIDDCFVEGNNSTGILGGVNVDEILVTNCSVRRNGADGCKLQGEGSVVTGNVFSDNDAAGLAVHTGTTVSGNQIRNNTSTGLTCLGNESTISTNIIEGNGARGIQLTSVDNNTISNNIIRNNTTQGVYLSGTCSDTLIKGNQIINNSGNGIRIDGANTGTKLVQNVVTGNVTDYNDLASDTNIIAIETSDAVLDLRSTTGALLLPRMTAAEASALTAVNGMILYATSTDATFLSVGVWAYEAGVWTKL